MTWWASEWGGKYNFLAFLDILVGILLSVQILLNIWVCISSDFFLVVSYELQVSLLNLKVTIKKPLL
jgi:hypothetical protein